MKKALFLGLMLGCVMFLAGCGQEASEDKTPEQIKQEVVSMNAADIEAMIAKYNKAIEAKAAELKKETDKLSKIPLTEQLGDEAKAVRANLDNLKDSAAKLQKNLEAYAEGLKEKSAK